MSTRTLEKLETKAIRHEYTPEEKITLGIELSRAIGAARGLEAELDEARASYKAKIAEAESRIERISTQLVNGWELRPVRCRVTFRPRDRKKDFRREGDPPAAEPVLTEDMTQDDFQADLLQAEARFERREEVALFPPAGASAGVVVVGRLRGRWFSALRILVGDRRIEERLDSEQKSVKRRYDAVRVAAQRALTWLKESLGKEAARGFEAPIAAAVEGQREREE